MTRVYVASEALAFGTGGRDGEDAPATPGAIESLRHLVDAGHEVVLVGSPPAGLEELPFEVSENGEPSGEPSGGWLITSDPEACGRRQPGLRSVLVGPRRPPTSRPVARCDVEARDLAAAVMEILTREAMA